MRWKTIAASDHDIRQSGASQYLTRHDLDVICTDGSWLTDALINYGVEECDGYGPPLSDLHNLVLWIKPSIVRAALEGDDDAFFDSLGHAIGGWHIDDPQDNVRGAAIILLPVNRGDRHWSLLAFYRAQKAEDCTFVHYDSLDPANTEAATALVGKLYTWNLLSTPFVITTEGGLERQRDGYNCGAFVIQYARKIMELGREPSPEELHGISSESCEDVRTVMRLALRPLIAEIPNDVAYSGRRPSYKDDDSGSPFSRPFTKEERLALLKKIHEHLQAEAAEPVVLGELRKCERTRPTTIVVRLLSTAPDVTDIDGGSVTFRVDGQPLTREVSFDGKVWMTSVKLQFQGNVELAITAKVMHGPEFVVETGAVEAFAVHANDEDRTIELSFDPKPPRRLFTRFLVEDAQENRDLTNDRKTRRPFPKDYALEFVFDDGRDRVTATLEADGTVISGDDRQPGIRVPYRYRHVTPEFPGTGKRQCIAWDEGAPPDTATTMIDPPGKDVPPGRHVGYAFPRGRWSPLRRTQHWTLPEIHDKDQSARFIDVAEDRPPGDQEHPITYVLTSEMPAFLMNGHLIEHVVCLMLENRGFDHFMGFLYEGHDQPLHSYPPPGEAMGQHAGLRRFEGLEGIDPVSTYDYDYTIEKKSWVPWGGSTHDKHNAKGVVKMRRGAHASNVPTTNPNEDFIHIYQDMYGAQVTDPALMERPGERAKLKDPPAMDGWAQNFCYGIHHHRGHETIIANDDPLVAEILEMYLPEQLPVMHGLARNYAVSDLWFCSVPSQTNTNRAFWCSGHAAGICKNDFYPAYFNHLTGNPLEYAMDKIPEGMDDNDVPFRRSLFDVLNEHKHEWRYYHHCKYPPVLGGHYFTTMFPQFEDSANAASIAEFYAAAKRGTLPAVTYIEPFWGGGASWEAKGRAVGNEFHPVQDMFNGEFFVKKVYDAVINGPAADTTVLVITFDENGGTYDHVPPWKATPPGREPREFLGEATPPGRHDTKGATAYGTEFDFKFDVFGVRVPTLVISKYVKKGTVFRSPTAVPFDHTSVISTILTWLGIDKDAWKLGERVANAPTFDGILQGDGTEEATRRTVATGLAGFDDARKRRIAKSTPIQYGQRVYFRYLGNKWSDDSKGKSTSVAASTYIAGPAMDGSVYAEQKGSARPFAFMGRKPGQAVKTGEKTTIGTLGRAWSGVRMTQCSLFHEFQEYVKTVPVKSNPTQWTLYLVNDRVDELELHHGDEVYIFDAQYDFDALAGDSLTHPTEGYISFEPYRRLALTDLDPKAPNVPRYVQCRVGAWDTWRIEVEPLALDPVMHDFPDVHVGATAPPVKVTITNMHPTQRTITLTGVKTRVSKGGPQPQIIGPPAGPLAHGESTAFTVTVTPQTTGMFYARVLLENDDETSPAIFEFVGAGVAAILKTVNEKDFGHRKKGLPGLDWQTIVLENTGNDDLHITSIHIDATINYENHRDFQVAPYPPTTVKPGASSTVRIAFQPLFAGPRKATLVVNSDALNTPILNIQLRGYGDP